MIPLRQRGVLSAQEINNIFSNVQVILNINTDLMADLNKVKKTKPSTQNIGEIFLSKVYPFCFKKTGFI